MDYGGKCGINNASPELLVKIGNIMETYSLYYQTAKMGRFDQGGGVTISYIQAKYNMDVIDCGIPMLICIHLWK